MRENLPFFPVEAWKFIVINLNACVDMLLYMLESTQQELLYAGFERVVYPESNSVEFLRFETEEQLISRQCIIGQSISYGLRSRWPHVNT